MGLSHTVETAPKKLRRAMENREFRQKKGMPCRLAGHPLKVYTFLFSRAMMR